MNDHKKKMIAPIIISIIFILYFCIYFGVIIYLLPSIWLKILVFIIPLALCLVMAYVCIQRIREIEGGEEDDLSKY